MKLPHTSTYTPVLPLMCQRGTTPAYILTKFLRLQNVSAMKCVNNREL